MPIYMDLHKIPGVTAKEVAEAHYKDVLVANEYQCRCMTYWVDEDKGSVFCLVDAPDKEAVIEMHTRAHGLVPHEIIQVDENVVQAFLGRIKDPEDTQDDGDLKIFNDPAFRAIMVTETIDIRLLRHSLGKADADELLAMYNAVVQEQFKHYGGREVESDGEGFVASFTSIPKAVECAVAIQKSLYDKKERIGLRIGLHAGMPVVKNEPIFGSIVKFAKHLCRTGTAGEILISSAIRSKCKECNVVQGQKMRWLSMPEDAFLESVMDTLSHCWHKPEFGIDEFCRDMSMSKPQLYRKTKSLTGMSPNALLRDYRLLRALDLLKKEDRNITQTTFDAGFTNPSYFTKCFHKKFGLHPLTYLKAQ